MGKRIDDLLGRLPTLTLSSASPPRRSASTSGGRRCQRDDTAAELPTRTASSPQIQRSLAEEDVCMRKPWILPLITLVTAALGMTAAGVAPASAASNTPLRVMPLGDSITWGGGKQYGQRLPGSVVERVLVTGASGGVGRFAVQLAARAGAHVIASVGSAARGEGLAEAGANEVLIGLDGLQRPVDVVIDSVGGPQLVAAWNLLSPGGSVQSVGWTSGEPAVFPPYATVGPAKSLTSFVIEGGVGADLAVLTELAAEGFLTVEIGWQGSWDRFDEASKALRGRRVSGKAVLAVASGELHAPVPSLQD
ncbi:zinc-binding dehydrogenase [Streptomyces sp. NBC_00183]|nr:zinc-binding dehydrogenase [Streptomyces sp. NBC_00183]